VVWQFFDSLLVDCHFADAWAEEQSASDENIWIKTRCEEVLDASCGELMMTTWEETVKNAPVKVPSSLDARISKSCDVWGSRIGRTLLQDLPEEERESLAEHVKTCSACAERVREYQVVEEFGRNILQYSLRSSKLEQMRLAAKERKHQRRKKSLGNKTLAMLISTWWSVLLIAVKTVKGTLALLNKGSALVRTLAIESLNTCWCRYR